MTEFNWHLNGEPVRVRVHPVQSQPGRVYISLAHDLDYINLFGSAEQIKGLAASIIDGVLAVEKALKVEEAK